MTRRALASFFIAVALAAPALADSKLLVCYPGKPGSPEQAQPTMDALAEQLTKRWGIADVIKATYRTDLAEAKKYLDEQKPEFGILSLSCWLAWKREGVSMKLLATGTQANKATQRYHLIVGADSPAKSLADLKGKKIPSSHVADERFVREVIFDGVAEAKDLQLCLETEHLTRAWKGCARGKVDAVLIDDDQLAFLKDPLNADLWKQLRVFWSSQELPLAAVVAFGEIKEDRCQALRKALFSFPKNAAQVKNDPEGAKLLETIQSTGFVEPDAPAYEAAGKAYAR